MSEVAIVARSFPDFDMAISARSHGIGWWQDQWADATPLARNRLQPRRAASIAAMSILCIVIIASNARLAAAGSGVGNRLRQNDWRDLPGQSPFVLAPAAGALVAAVADDRVPIAIRFGLVRGGDLKRERFVVLDVGPETTMSRSRAVAV